MAGFGMPTTLLQAIGDRVKANVMAVQTFVDTLMYGFVHNTSDFWDGCLDGPEKEGMPLIP